MNNEIVGRPCQSRKHSGFAEGTRRVPSNIDGQVGDRISQGANESNAPQLFVIRISFVIRHWLFVIWSSLALAQVEVTRRTQLA